MIPAFQGISLGFGLGIQDIETREVEKGNHLVPSAIQRIEESLLSLSFVQIAVGISNWIVMPIQVVLVGALVGIHYLIHQKQLSGRAQEICIAFANAITPLMRIINIVSVIALFYFGNFIVGGIVLALYGIALLDSQGLLPEIVQKAYYKVVKNDYIF